MACHKKRARRQNEYHGQSDVFICGIFCIPKGRVGFRVFLLQGRMIYIAFLQDLPRVCYLCTGLFLSHADFCFVQHKAAARMAGMSNGQLIKTEISLASVTPFQYIDALFINTSTCYLHNGSNKAVSNGFPPSKKASSVFMWTLTNQGKFIIESLSLLSG